MHFIIISKEATINYFHRDSHRKKNVDDVDSRDDTGDPCISAKIFFFREERGFWPSDVGGYGTPSSEAGVWGP